MMVQLLNADIVWVGEAWAIPFAAQFEPWM